MVALRRVLLTKRFFYLGILVVSGFAVLSVWSSPSDVYETLQRQMGRCSADYTTMQIPPFLQYDMITGLEQATYENVDDPLCNAEFPCCEPGSVQDEDLCDDRKGDQSVADVDDPILKADGGIMNNFPTKRTRNKAAMRRYRVNGGTWMAVAVVKEKVTLLRGWFLYGRHAPRGTAIDHIVELQVIHNFHAELTGGRPAIEGEIPPPQSVIKRMYGDVGLDAHCPPDLGLITSLNTKPNFMGIDGRVNVLKTYILAGDIIDWTKWTNTDVQGLQLYLNRSGGQWKSVTRALGDHFNYRYGYGVGDAFYIFANQLLESALEELDQTIHGPAAALFKRDPRYGSVHLK